MKRGCPECEVTALYSEFIEEVDEELALLAERQGHCEEGRGADYKWRWSRDKLIHDVSFISGMNARVNNKGYDPEWPIPIKNLIVIIRQEQTLQDRIADDERDRELKNQLNGGRQTDR